MPPILNFVTPALALKYFSLCFLAVTGALQIAAGRRGIEGLSLLPASFRFWQVLLGLALIAGSFAIFFAITPEVFTPGLAGSELIFLFGCGGIASLLFTLTIAEVRGGSHFPPLPPDAEEELTDGKVALFGGRPGEGVDFCLIPDPWEPFSLDRLARFLANSGRKVAVLHWTSIPDYEAALGFPALAMEKCKPRTIVGHRAGGNIALRLALGSGVKAIAIAPFTKAEEAEPGLNWLEESGIFTAWKRLRGRKKLIEELLPLQKVPNSVIIPPEGEIKPWRILQDEVILRSVVDKILKEGTGDERLPQS
jgi:hypothetical protein